jgi:hypothetical protein
MHNVLQVAYVYARLVSSTKLTGLTLHPALLRFSIGTVEIS